MTDLTEARERLDEILDEIRDLKAERDRLEAALKQCILVVLMWHGLEVFDIYYDCAPEMKLIRKALPEYGLILTGGGKWEDQRLM